MAAVSNLFSCAHHQFCKKIIEDPLIALVYTRMYINSMIVVMVLHMTQYRAVRGPWVENRRVMEIYR